MRGISWLAENRLASQGVCCMEEASYSNYWLMLPRQEGNPNPFYLLSLNAFTSQITIPRQYCTWFPTQGSKYLHLQGQAVKEIIQFIRFVGFLFIVDSLLWRFREISFPFVHSLMWTSPYVRGLQRVARGPHGINHIEPENEEAVYKFIENKLSLKENPAIV
jgi:hypothetical protein